MRMRERKSTERTGEVDQIFKVTFPFDSWLDEGSNVCHTLTITFNTIQTHAHIHFRCCTTVVVSQWFFKRFSLLACLLCVRDFIGYFIKVFRWISCQYNKHIQSKWKQGKNVVAHITIKIIINWSFQWGFFRGIGLLF